MHFLSGYKTYIIGTLMILIGIVHTATGDSDTGQRYILEGLAFCSLRNGLSKLT